MARTPPPFRVDVAPGGVGDIARRGMRAGRISAAADVLALAADDKLLPLHRDCYLRAACRAIGSAATVNALDLLRGALASPIAAERLRVLEDMYDQIASAPTSRTRPLDADAPPTAIRPLPSGEPLDAGESTDREAVAGVAAPGLALPRRVLFRRRPR